MIIIDTYNLLHASLDSSFGRRLDLDTLQELLSSGRYAKERVVLVLDGVGKGASQRAEPGLSLGGGGRGGGGKGGGGVSIIHAGSGKDADSLIEQVLEVEQHQGRGRQVLVVSSDKRVRNAATGARARSMSSADFLNTLVEDVRKRGKRATEVDGGRPDFARDGGMDAGRTAYWLGVFGLGGGVDESADPERTETPGAQPVGDIEAAREATLGPPPPAPARPKAKQPAPPPAPADDPESWLDGINVDDLDTGKWLEKGPPAEPKAPNTRRQKDDTDDPPASPRPTKPTPRR